MQWHLSFLNTFSHKNISYFQSVFDAADVAEANTKTEAFIDLTVGSYHRNFAGLEYAINYRAANEAGSYLEVEATLQDNKATVAYANLITLDHYFRNQQKSEAGHESLEGDFLIRDMQLSLTAGVPNAVYLARVRSQYDVWVVEEANRRIFHAKQDAET